MIYSIKINSMELKNTMLAFLALAFFDCQEQKYVPVTTFQEAEDPVAISTEAENLWNRQENS